MAACKIMTKPEDARFEAHAKSKLLGLPNYIRSSVIAKISNMYCEATPDLAQRLANAIELKVTLQTKLPFSLTGLDHRKPTHNRVSVKKPLINLLSCLSRYLTVIQYGHCIL
jgi:hypothetical protein